MKNFEHFFERYGDYNVRTRYFDQTDASFTVDEMYEAFKARLAHEQELARHPETCCLRTGTWHECDCGLSQPGSEMP
jgi:hypothetical protein